MSADILCSRAWQDYDNRDDADGGWRIEHLWCDTGARPSYTVCDSDGNHEPLSYNRGAVLNREVDRYVNEADDSWKTYESWVYEHGSDPLWNYMVWPTRKVTEKWAAMTSRYVGWRKFGLGVRWFLHQRRRITPDKAPRHVREFFCLRKRQGRYVMDGICKDSDIVHANRLPNDYVVAEVERTEPNPDYVQELRRIIERSRNERLVERPS